MQAYQEIRYRGLCSDPESYEKCLQRRDYPKLFRQIERDLSDDRNALAELIKPLLKHDDRAGRIYQLIAAWPFACYLTTNYDDEISRHLKSLNEHYTVRRNRPADFHVWRDGVHGVIQKLHSDLDHPKEAIITSTDYDRLENTAGEYYRLALTSVFTMFDVLIIGHSLSDPDIDLILKAAKNIRAPYHPIYMVATDYTMADEKELIERHNIVLVRYSNGDGNHSDLLRLLQTADRFIVSRRHSTTDLLPTAPKEQTKAAVAIYLYRRLQGVQATDYLSPLILVGLASRPPGNFTLNEIRSLPVLTNLIGERPTYDQRISATLYDLVRRGLVEEKSSTFMITEEGRTKVKEYHSVRELQMDQAYGHFRLHLKGLLSGGNGFPTSRLSRPSGGSDCSHLFKSRFHNCEHGFFITAGSSPSVNRCIRACYWTIFRD